MSKNTTVTANAPAGLRQTVSVDLTAAHRDPVNIGTEWQVNVTQKRSAFNFFGSRKSIDTHVKVQIGNGILEFFGSHVFSIYILQRLPMIILQKMGFAASHKYLYVVLCFFATIAMAVLFDLAMDRLDGVLFTRRREKAKIPAAE